MNADSTTGGTDSDEGGRGWRVRRSPDLPADHLKPMSTAPPPELLPPSPAPPPDAPVPSPQRRRNVAIAAVGAIALFVLAGGGAVLLSGGHPVSPATPASGAPGTTSPPNGQAALTAAVQRAEGGPMRADLSMTESFTATGPGGADMGAWAGGEIIVTIHIDQQSPTRSELRETVRAPGVQETVIAVLYDDTVYVSSDNGASYQTVTVDRADTAELSPRSPLQFLDMMGDVKPTGDVEVNGATASSYHATLDPVKVGNYIKNELAQQKSPELDKVLNSLGVTDGTLDAAVDAQGNLISESGTIDAAIDLGAFSPADAGSTLNMHEGITGAFSDYGASVDVTKPGVVTGPATI